MAIVYDGDVAHPRSWGYDGSLNDVLIRLAVSEATPLRSGTAPAQAQRIDTSESGEDIVDEVGQRYSRTDLTGGAGLDFLHSPTRPDNASVRFWDSRGVDVFKDTPGEAYCVQLLHNMDLDTAQGGANQHLAAIDDNVYHTAQANIYVLGTGASQATESAAITRMRALGNSLYTLNATDGVTKYTPSINWTGSNVSTTAFDDIWAVKGRVMGVVDNILYEAGATDTTVLTIEANETFTDVVDAGPVLVAFATTGDAYILSLDNSLALQNAGVTQFTEEVPALGAARDGAVFVTTTSTNDAGGVVTRFYASTLAPNPDNTYSLQNIQLVYQIGDEATTEDLSAEFVFSTRDSVYAAIPEEGENTVTFYRYYLPTGGYARAEEMDFGSALSVSSADMVNDNLYVAVPTSGVWKEEDTYVAEGWVIGPAADHYTVDNKQWTQARMTLSANLDSNDTAQFYDATDIRVLSEGRNSTGWTLAATVLSNTSEIKSDLFNRISRYHVGMAVLQSGTGATTPCFQAWSIRALPNPDREELWQIPVNVSDQFESPQRRRLRAQGRGTELRKVLEQMAGEQAELKLYLMDVLLRGLVESVEPGVISHPDLGSPTNVMFITIRGRQQYGGIVTTGMTFGSTMFGEYYFGGEVA